MDSNPPSYEETVRKKPLVIEETLFQFLLWILRWTLLLTAIGVFLIWLYPHMHPSHPTAETGFETSSFSFVTPAEFDSTTEVIILGIEVTAQPDAINERVPVYPLFLDVHRYDVHVNLPPAIIKVIKTTSTSYVASTCTEHSITSSVISECSLGTFSTTTHNKVVSSRTVGADSRIQIDMSTSQVVLHANEALVLTIQGGGMVKVGASVTWREYR